MNAAPSTERVQQLLEVVERQRDSRCAQIIDEARAEARQLMQQARQQARARLHDEIMSTRQKLSRQLKLQQASQAARQRQTRFQQDRALLDRTWTLMTAALERRWQDPEARRIWVETVTEQARARLVQTDWRIEHPADWPAEEREETARAVSRALHAKPAFAAEASLRAGIRVRAGDTLVDGSCEGLLRDRVHIEALLLAALRKSGIG
jgi:F0F1-type ATP synthase membrane subunit b/b'